MDFLNDHETYGCDEEFGLDAALDFNFVEGLVRRSGKDTVGQEEQCPFGSLGEFTSCDG